MVTIEATAIAAAVVGAILGSFGTYVLGERSRRKEEAKQIKNLRRSFLAELGSMDELAVRSAPKSPFHMPLTSSIPTEVFQNNADRVSLLNPQESSKLVRFYSGVIKLKETINATRDMLDSHPELQDASNINEGIEKLQREWKECALELMDSAGDYPQRINFNERTIEVDESISSKDLWMVLNHSRLEEGIEEFEVE